MRVSSTPISYVATTLYSRDDVIYQYRTTRCELITIGIWMSVQSNFACVILYIFLHYCHLTNFFWMFVEGLYLYMLVVETFTRENIKLRVYFLIGWGLDTETGVDDNGNGYTEMGVPLI
ncbi:hypothetical protein M8J77_015187 [Diaphorina citri]|nr:hypothetical protein M8J77_015187 [Diaphorina citri]